MLRHILALSKIPKESSPKVTSTPHEEREMLAKLFVSIKNTMSDQCATNGVFNDLLKDIRSKVLPDFVSNFEK